MSEIRVVNVEVISGIQIRITYDQPVKADASYYTVGNYLLTPPLTIASIQSVSPSTAVSYTIINFTHYMKDIERYNVRVSGITNLIDEGVDSNYDSHSFIGNSTKPTITSVVATDEDTIRVTYDRIMDEESVSNLDNYSVTSDFTGHTIYMESVSYNSTYVDITIDSARSPMTHGLDHTMIVSNIKDYNGNVIEEKTSKLFDGICTTLTQLTDVYFTAETDPDQIFLVFDRPIDRDSARSLSAFTIKPDASGLEAYYGNVSFGSEDKRITLEISETSEASTYTVTCTSALKDVFGNTIDPSNDDGTFIGSGHNPSLKYIKFISSSLVEVHFDEPMRYNVEIRKASNYSISGGVVVQKVISVNAEKVLLATSKLQTETSYTLTISTSSITDAAGNGLTLPATAFNTTDEEFATSSEPVQLFDFITQTVRDMDSSTALERFVGAFQVVYDNSLNVARSLPNVGILETMKDEHLYYVRSFFGWNGYEPIIKKLSYSQLRKLYANSYALWKRRGAYGSVYEIMNLLFKATVYELNFFHSSWSLGYGHLTDHLENESCDMLSDSGIYTTFIKIPDPDGEIDVECTESLINLFRPQVETFMIQYLIAYDDFGPFFSKDSYKLYNAIGDSENTLYTTTNNTLVLDNDTEKEIFFISTKQSSKFDNVCLYAKFMSTNTTTGTYGFALRYIEGATNHYEVDISPSAQEVLLKKAGSTIATIDMSAEGIDVSDDEVKTLRVELQTIGSNDWFNIYVDGNIIYSGSTATGNSVGSVGIYHTPDTELIIDAFEFSKLPAMVTVQK